MSNVMPKVQAYTLVELMVVVIILIVMTAMFPRIIQSYSLSRTDSELADFNVFLTNAYESALLEQHTISVVFDLNTQLVRWKEADNIVHEFQFDQQHLQIRITDQYYTAEIFTYTIVPTSLFAEIQFGFSSISGVNFYIYDVFTRRLRELQ